ncbi:MAG: DUF819 family protein, partial [Lysobacterales bacterium]
MISTVWPYVAVLLFAAGLFPSLEARYGWRVFNVLPPIVWTYLLVTALAVAGLWQGSDEIHAAQRALTAQLLPALLFLLMVTCDLRAIIALGPRLLAVFACAMASMLLAVVFAYAMFRHALPADGWKMLALLSATWTGGSANLVAVKEIVALPENLLPPVLLADALCYSTWIVVLFATSGLAPAFNRWTRATPKAPLLPVEGLGRGFDPAHYPVPAKASSSSDSLPRSLPPGGRDDVRERDATLQEVHPGPSHAGQALLWLGIALMVGLGAAALGARMPVATMFTQTSWTVLFATLAGLAIARTPLARVSGPTPLASALLACLVAVLGSQSNFEGMSAAPLFVLVGFCVLALHAMLLLGAARLFRFDLHLCGIASLAGIGGAATAP